MATLDRLGPPTARSDRPRAVIGAPPVAVASTVDTELGAEEPSAPIQASRGSKLAIYLLVFSLILPFSMYLGPLRISPYRLILIIYFFPAIIALLSGRCGGFKIYDACMIFFVGWAALALVVSAPTLGAAIEPAGSFVVEHLGAYALARYAVRSPSDFYTFIRLLLVILTCLFPFTLYESMTGNPIIIMTLSKFLPTYADAAANPRFGIHRAQVVFEHSILYGIFASSIIAISVYGILQRRSFIIKVIVSGFTVFCSILSVSTAAMAAIVFQFALMGWRWATRALIPIRKPWRLLLILAIIIYFVLDIASNRTPFHVFVSYLTLGINSGYNRILIFNYGILEIGRYPFFGLGIDIDQWARPRWMSGSMDNYWLLIAVKHGLPAFIPYVYAICVIMRRLGALQSSYPDVERMRTGLLITLAGLILAAATAHYWNAIAVYFMFLLGSGIWMLEYRDKSAA